MGKPGLRRSRADPPGDLPDRHIPAFRDFPRQKLGLIKSTPPEAKPVQRHGDNQIETLLSRERPEQKISKWPRQWPHSFIFQQVNQLAERTIIGTVGINRIKTGKPQPAQPASPVLIERRTVQKRRTARGAAIFSNQRFRFLKATAANGDSKNFLEGFAADTAVIGE